MIVSQLDKDGYFVASVLADESPLEPGVFLIPGGAVAAEPPQLPIGTRARFDGDGWVFEPILTATPPADDPPVVTHAQRWAAHQRMALSALDESDITVIRCVEADVPVPQSWRDYRAALRLIVSSAVGDPDVGLPARPDYPPGT